MLEFGTTRSYEEKVLSKAIKKYGGESQCRMVMEECAELIQATNKMLRDEYNIDNLVLEMSHVQIMIRQLQLMFNIDYARLDTVRHQELIRLENKIDKETSV